MEKKAKFIATLGPAIYSENKLKKIDNIKIQPDFNYSLIKTLSAEAVQKLSKIKPTNLGQASRISGVSPSDISNLMIYLDKK